MAKRIVLSKKAEIDLITIIEFNNLRNQSDTYSKKLFLKLNKRLELLLKQPLNGIKTDANTLLLIWDQYYVFYTFDTDTILIESIYHQKQNVL